ncbi:class GN sortase [Glaciecola sp. MF2-115]|uniref:class GN sortase n=1 Tax=Glaciecola sp. MF2-115 TaxID=3384827 RepID=UPI00399FDF36
MMLIFKSLINKQGRINKCQINLKNIISLSLFAIAILFIFDGFYIQAKAKYAQYLIAKSWSHYMHTGEHKKPWPWADTHPIAKLDMYQTSQYILAGASGRNLAFGPAHLMQTAALGKPGNAVVAGHRDTHFEVLKKAKLGDLIYLTSRNEYATTEPLKQVYRVSSIEIVDQHNLDVLDSDIMSTSVTLITCYPFDSVSPNPSLRYVVKADKI